MENKKLFDSSDIFSMLQAYELQPRLELQSSGTNTCLAAFGWADCGCGIMNCCPYITGYAIIACS
jgi:hypothetical protein